MKAYILVMLGLLVLGGCAALPNVIDQLSKDKASVCGEVHGGPLGVPWGVTRFCRANSDNESLLTIDKDGAISVDHNKK